MGQYNASSLVREPTCFKSIGNPSCIDLFITNKSKSFQNTITRASVTNSDFETPGQNVKVTSVQTNKNIDVF